MTKPNQCEKKKYFAHDFSTCGEHENDIKALLFRSEHKESTYRAQHILTQILRYTKATSTHTEYVTYIAFPLQQWLHERASLLRYTYIACLVIS